MSDGARLTFLIEVADLEPTHLETTTGRLFDRPFDTERARALKADVDDAERTDAFVARFARLQDTVGDKRLPAVLAALAETVGPAIDNLDRAEKPGLLSSAEDWLAARRLRNRMVLEYVRDPALLAEALNQGRCMVPMLAAFARDLAEACRQRGLVSR